MDGSRKGSDEFPETEPMLAMEMPKDTLDRRQPPTPNGTADADLEHSPLFLPQPTRPSLSRVSSYGSTISNLDAIDPEAAASAAGKIPVRGFRGWVNENTGILIIALAQLFFSCMNVSAKLLSGYGVPALEIVFVRMSITYVLSIAYMWHNGIPDFILGPPGIRLLLIIRGAIGFWGLFGIYYSLQYLSLSDATTITFMAPILAGILAWWFLGEPYTRVEACGGLVSFLGVVLIARPASLFSHPASSPSPSPSPSGGSGVIGSEAMLSEADQTHRLYALGIALLGVLGAAGAYTAIRAIGKRAHPLISVSYFALYSTIFSCILSLIFRTPFHFPLDPIPIVLLLVIGVSGFAAQFLLTMGLQREKAGRGTMMVYLQCVIAFLGEWAIWGHVPDIWSWLGATFVLGGAIWVAITKAKKAEGEKMEEARDAEVRMPLQRVLSEAGPSASLDRVR
ncbi:hypothetical protein YB2330_000846 [Saitoella coloradoensis]